MIERRGSVVGSVIRGAHPGALAGLGKISMALILALAGGDVARGDSVWTRGGNESGYWGEAGNWSEGVPDSLERAKFVGSTARATADVNVNTSVGQIGFRRSANESAIDVWAGNTLSVSGEVSVGYYERASIFDSTYLYDSGRGQFKGSGSVVVAGGTSINSWSALRLSGGISYETDSVFIGSQAQLTVDEGTVHSDIDVNRTAVLDLGGNPGGGSSWVNGDVFVWGPSYYINQWGYAELIQSGGLVRMDSSARIDGQLTVEGGAEFYNSSVGSLHGYGSVAGGNGTAGGNLTLTGIGGGGNFGGVISGDQGIRLTGNVLQTLSGANPYTGDTTAQSGTIQITGSVSNTGVARATNGGSLDVSGGQLTAREVIAANGGDVTVRNGGRVNATQGTVVGETGTGKITVAGGTLTTPLVTVLDDGFLDVNRMGGSRNSVVEGNVSVRDGGTVRVDGNGMSSNYAAVTGTIDLQTGGATLNMGNNARIGAISGNGQVTTGGLDWNMVRIGTNGGSTVHSGTISGAGGFEKVGAGTWTLTGTNTYTGQTSVTGGTLKVTGDITQSGRAYVAEAGRLDVDGGEMNADHLYVHAGGQAHIRNGGALHAATYATVDEGGVVKVDGGTLEAPAVVVESQGLLDVNLTGAAGRDSVVDGSATIEAGGLMRLHGNEGGIGRARLTGEAHVLGTLAYGDNAEIGAISGVGTINSGGVGSNMATIGINNESTTFSGSFIGAGGFRKVGAGTLTLEGLGYSYTGRTYVDQGTLRVDGDTSSSGMLTVGAGSVLTGNGRVGSLDLEGALSAGAGVGMLTAGDTSLGEFGAIIVDMASAIGGAGQGWDLLEIEGSLDLTRLALGGFTIDVRSLLEDGVTAGDAAGFDASASYEWVFASFDSLVGDFDASMFTVTWSAFTNDLMGGAFGVRRAGNALALTFDAAEAPVPEPGTWALAGLTLAALGARRARRGRVSGN